jgi:signal transduction histidine kinase
LAAFGFSEAALVSVETFFDGDKLAQSRVWSATRTEWSLWMDGEMNRPSYLAEGEIGVSELQSRGRATTSEAAMAKRLARQIAIISEVGSEVIALHDTGTVLQEVVSGVQQGMDYRWVAVTLLEEGGPVIKAQSPEESPALFKLSEASVPGLAWRDWTTQHVMASLSLSSGDSDSPDVVVPLRVQDRVLGWLIVRFGASDIARETEQPFLSAVASLIAVAVENIRLFNMALEQSHYLDQRAGRLSQMLSASNHLLRLSPHSASLLLAVARLAHESLGFRLSAASWLDQASGQLVTQLLVTTRPGALPEVCQMCGDWQHFVRLLRPEFRVSRSYRISSHQVDGQLGAGDPVAQVDGEMVWPFHLPEVFSGGEPWRPYKALLVPLQGRGGRITGVLTLDYPEDDRLPSLEMVQTAEIFANQAVVALDNARLFEELQRRLRETNTLFAMGQEIVTTLDQCEVLDAIGRAALTLVTSADKVVIHLLDEAGGLIPHLVCPARPGVSASAGMRVGEGIAGLAAAQNRALYVPDVSQDRRFVGQLANYLSLLVVPVSVGERVIGTLSVDSPQVDAFRPDDERVLIILANQAAIALDNAGLYAKAKRVDELAALNRLVSRLATSLDRRRLLHIAIEQIARTLKAEAGVVVLLREDERHSTPHIVYCHHKKGVGRKEAFYELESHELLPVVSEGDLLAVLSGLGIIIHQQLHAILVAHDRVIGYVEVYNLFEEEASDEVLSLLNSMATAVAMALENARLYEEVRDSAEELAASQAQLIQSAKLAATGNLAASIAHELNNPLQAVQSCVYLLSDSVSPDDPNRPYLDIAQEELDRIARIVGQMVDFYRPAKERREPADVNQLLESVLALVYKRVQQSGIQLRADLESNLPKIVATADHIKQVFLNVVLNALDAMPDGGELVVTTRLVVVPERILSLLPETQQVEIRFADTGLGIATEDLSRIFDPFFTRKPKGTGLGLSISYDIVERHGGTIEVESAPGQGTIFTIRLPIHSGTKNALEVKL